MLNNQILDYVREAVRTNIPRDQIAKNLLASGWQVSDINEALAAVPLAAPSPTSSEFPAPPAPATSWPTAAAPSVAQPTIPPVTAPAQSTPPPPPPTQPQPPVATIPPMPMQGVPVPHTGFRSKMPIIAISLVLVISIAGFTYAFFQKLGPFAQVPYSEKNILSGLLAKSATINTATYSLSSSLAVEPREADARPFTLTISNEAERRMQYENDSRRMSDAREILSTLRYSYDPYPSSLSQPSKSRSYFSSRTMNLTDPVTKKPYGYKLTEGRKNFELSVTFETKDAISAVKRGYRYAATTTIVSGQTVTFTKNSDGYVYLSSKPPEPFFIGLQEMASYLPAQIAASLSMGATSDFTKENADWSANVDAKGDFGDLTYQVSGEALKKDGVYYLKITHLPSLFGSITAYKDQWIKFDPKAPTSTDPYSYNELTYYGHDLSRAESSYKQSRADLVDLLKKAASIADEEKLIAFKRAPYAERVNGQLLYRYDLKINKDALLPFYQRLGAEAEKSKTFAHSPLEDEGLIEYLQSEEFNQVFAYYEQNTALTLWVTSEGYLAGIEYTIRFVPADSATALKDKQARIVLKGLISGINAGVSISAPKDAKAAEDLMGSARGSASLKSRDAQIQSELSSIRAYAEIYYGENNSSYGKSGNSCSAKGSLFADKSIQSSVSRIEQANGSHTMVCNNTSSAYAAASQLVAPSTTMYHCVDSTGTAGTRTTPLGKNTVCPSR